MTAGLAGSSDTPASLSRTRWQIWSGWLNRWFIAIMTNSKASLPITELHIDMYTTIRAQNTARVTVLFSRQNFVDLSNTRTSLIHRHGLFSKSSTPDYCVLGVIHKLRLQFLPNFAPPPPPPMFAFQNPFPSQAVNVRIR